MSTPPPPGQAPSSTSQPVKAPVISSSTVQSPGTSTVMSVNVGAPPIHIPPKLGVKTLTLGATGTGKTHSLRTFKSRGIKVFVLFTENGMDSLQDTDPEWVDWHYIPAAIPNIQAMINMAQKINTMDRKQIAAYDDPFRSKHQQFVEVLQCMSNLKGDRTGKTYGPADKLDTEWCIATDSLSGLSIMSKELVGGDKPIFDQGEWGMAMERIEKLVTMVCMNMPAHVVVNAHEEREPDEISGSTKIMVSVLGKKLAPKIPKFFDNVFYSFRKDTEYLWSSNYPGAFDLKSRSFGVFASKAQDYGAVIDAWKKKQGT